MTRSPHNRKRTAKTPLAISELRLLFDHIDEHTSTQGCDNTLRVASKWLADRGHDSARVVDWLERNGGYCDCEVLLNVEPKVDAS